MELNFREYGSGRPIIILHGLFGMLDNWQSIGKKLANHFHVYLVDQRNHGRSPHTDDYDYEFLAKDIEEFISQQAIAQPILIGHSMGGKTVMECCKLFPSHIEKAIIVDIAPKAYQGGHNTIFQSILSIDLSAYDSRKDVQKKLAENISDQGVLLFLMKNLTRTPEGTYRWKANFQALHDNYDSILDSITFDQPSDVDTLFIRGSNSTYIQESDLELIRSLFTNVDMKTVDNAGHWVHAQNPTQLLEFIYAFVN